MRHTGYDLEGGLEGGGEGEGGREGRQTDRLDYGACGSDQIGYEHSAVTADPIAESLTPLYSYAKPPGFESRSKRT